MEVRPIDVGVQELQTIAAEAYEYAYPLVICELTRRVSVAKLGAPMNEFQHLRAFPDASFTDVVRPNADTLYSQLWFDVSSEPIAINVPDSRGRYYLLQMLDMWSDVFASPGSRTTGTGAQTIVLAGSDWRGSVPPGAILIYSPTAIGWIIGRTQTNGVSDCPNVHAFQDGMSVAPLGGIGKLSSSTRAVADATWDVTSAPADVIDKLSAEQYFGLFAELMKLNPPHANDYPIMHRMARIGIEPGKSFSFVAAPAEVRRALEGAAGSALAGIRAGLSGGSQPRNGWSLKLGLIGTYGTAYRARAGVAYAGLGANPPDDAIYPSAFADADGTPLSSANRYVVHFAKEQTPPVRAFWSLTVYDERQAFAANPIDRYAIGDRDPLAFNPDGSLDLYIQRASPGGSKESNWLPTPADGPFSVTLRMYWPKSDALNGTWAPPPIVKVA